MSCHYLTIWVFVASRRLLNYLELNIGWLFFTSNPYIIMPVSKRCMDLQIIKGVHIFEHLFGEPRHYIVQSYNSQSPWWRLFGHYFLSVLGLLNLELSSPIERRVQIFWSGIGQCKVNRFIRWRWFRNKRSISSIFVLIAYITLRWHYGLYHQHKQEIVFICNGGSYNNIHLHDEKTGSSWSMQSFIVYRLNAAFISVKKCLPYYDFIFSISVKMKITFIAEII